MDLVEYNFKRSINASREAILWNYWDHEHLYVVHENYEDVKVVYEDDKMAVYFLKYKLPILRFMTSDSLNLMYMSDKNTIKVFNRGLLNLVSETTINIQEITENKCDIYISYKFYLNGWKKILKPMLKKMTSRWNQKVWDEDFSLKIRRTKLINLGFKDFHGMTNQKKKVQEFSLPIKRHTKSPINIKKKISDD